MREYVWTTAKALWVVAVLACVAGIVASFVPDGPDTAPPPVTLANGGTAVTGDARPLYGDARVFGGPDGPVKLADDPAVNAGVCRTYGDTDNVEPHGLRHVVVCVPIYGPEGTHLTGRVEEDGSARYGTDADPDIWTLDPETAQFYRQTVEYYGGN